MCTRYKEEEEEDFLVVIVNVEHLDFACVAPGCKKVKNNEIESGYKKGS